MCALYLLVCICLRLRPLLPPSVGALLTTTSIPTVSLCSFLVFSQRFTSFACHRLLSEENTEKRARLIEGSILLASHSYELGNVAGAVAILSSLTNPVVRRLDQTWTEVEPVRHRLECASVVCSTP
jgi:RasGEF domain